MVCCVRVVILALQRGIEVFGHHHLNGNVSVQDIVEHQVALPGRRQLEEVLQKQVHLSLAK